MKLNCDDPRLTAYALGEMSESERAAFENELKLSPECLQVVEEIRETAALMSAELRAEPQVKLSHQQRAVIDEAKGAEIIPFPRHRISPVIPLAALAACVMLSLVWIIGSGTEPSGQSTKSGATPTELKIAFAPPEPTDQGPLKEQLVRDNSLVEVTQNDNKALGFDWVDANKLEAGSEKPAGTLVLNSTLTVAPGASDSRGLAWVSPSHGGGVGGGGASPPGTYTAYEPKLTEAQTASSPMPVSPAMPPARWSREADSLSVAVDGYADSDVMRKRLADSDVRYHFSWREEDRDSRRMLAQSRSWNYETAAYPRYKENDFERVIDQPLSTFSIDVDTASYANTRRFLQENRLPPRDAVRIEEMINYFKYDYPQPKGTEPFSASIEVAGCPWKPEHRLVRIGIKGREIAEEKRPPSNFVFLIDVSGSMRPDERLPLLKQALRQLVKKMAPSDRVAIVVYADNAGVKLMSISCERKEKILEAIDELEAGGSTNGGDGIQQAYRIAQENFIEGGVNRVLLCTDGDFNVGITNQDELIRMIQEKARGGVFLTTLGVGTSNYKDALMQKLADRGNGNYHYLDTLEEAQKVLIEQMSATLVTIAKDVKIQIEFNPARVGAYRLIGYEKRMLAEQDFNNDARDAGEIGAGHTITALYELAPAGSEVRGAVDGLKYQRPVEEPAPRQRPTGSDELLTLKLRYKQPEGDTSKLTEFAARDSGRNFNQASADFRFAAAVASFGMLLKDSEHKGRASYESVLEIARNARGTDTEGYRAEFLTMVRKARELAPAREQIPVRARAE